jgi:Eco57I restriction-modification methylase
MARVKYKSNKKQQLGQFMTPLDLSKSILKSYIFKITDKILEPSMGDGSFVIAIIEKFLNEVYIDSNLSKTDKINTILKNNLVGVEIDAEYFNKCIENIKQYFDINNINLNNFYLDDFLVWSDYKNDFDIIIGNPPFGGTINMEYQENLDKKYGKRNNKKIKKETYSFFLIKCIEEHLKEFGQLIFILSDTFMTIKTMHGLRYFLMKNGCSSISTIDKFSEETDYSMLVIEYLNNIIKNHIVFNGNKIDEKSMDLTNNFSWYIPDGYSKYFNGNTVGDYMIGSGGLTTGRNEYFVRNISDNKIIEEYDFNICDKLITLKDELSNARYNKLSDNKINEIINLENSNKTKKDVNIIKRDQPLEIKLPHNDYKYYNKSDGKLLYSEPKYVIFWKNDGESVITYKKNNRWHLRGVGGQKFYGKEGITWQLIASEIKPRYLPSGYILDNSGPILTLKKNVEKDELYFIISWLISNKATLILKEVLNHTRNIQSKDLERLPYPSWISKMDKNILILETKSIINHIKSGKNYDMLKYKQRINKIFNEQ